MLKTVEEVYENVVTGVKQSKLLYLSLGLGLEFDKNNIKNNKYGSRKESQINSFLTTTKQLK